MEDYYNGLVATATHVQCSLNFRWICGPKYSLNSMITIKVMQIWIECGQWDSESVARNQFNAVQNNEHKYIIIYCFIRPSTESAIDWAIYGRAQDTSISAVFECASCIYRSSLIAPKVSSSFHILQLRTRTVLSFDYCVHVRHKSSRIECVLLWWNGRYTLCDERKKHSCVYSKARWIEHNFFFLPPFDESIKTKYIIIICSELQASVWW